MISVTFLELKMKTSTLVLASLSVTIIIAKKDLSLDIDTWTEVVQAPEKRLKTCLQFLELPNILGHSGSSGQPHNKSFFPQYAHNRHGAVRC